ncbi:MAG: helix-turn-helix transcriptional regulator [Verrucomicrobia bacterium]|nr:helix-turn-helix transcriptional regulator [Verrucomicrobiota bacterium]
MNEKLFFNRQLGLLRHKRHLTQEQLAEKSGLSRNYIGLLEIGHRQPSLTTTLQIQRALGVKLKDLVGEGGESLRVSEEPVKYSPAKPLSAVHTSQYDRLVRRLARCSIGEIDMIVKVVRAILKGHRAPKTSPERRARKSQ